MDSADALLSYRSRERMLEIMKDSRVGAMGVLACVLLLLLKAALLAAFIEGGTYYELPLLLLPPVWSRWYMVRAMARYPVARGNEGLAASFAELPPRQERRALLTAALLSLAAAAAPLALGAASGTFTAASGGGLPCPGVRSALRTLRGAADQQPARRAHRRCVRRAERVAGGPAAALAGAATEGPDVAGRLCGELHFRRMLEQEQLLRQYSGSRKKAGRRA